MYCIVSYCLSNKALFLGIKKNRYPDVVIDVFLELIYTGHTLEIKKQMARGNIPFIALHQTSILCLPHFFNVYLFIFRKEREMGKEPQASSTPSV